MDKVIHIISPEPPYPVLHGGRFDLFYKIVALHRAGIGVHLHCFSAEQNTESELDKYCLSVHYYRRTKGFRSVSTTLPYIVRSRRSNDLLSNLLKDDHPILFEGIHSTDTLNHYDFGNRKLMLRLHNLEHVYYRKLYHSTHDPFKRIYYLTESLLLKRYEKKVAAKFSIILAVSVTDAEVYKKDFAARRVEFVPVFVDFAEMPVSTDGYCLYHGNLAVPENEAAVRFLARDVFSQLRIPLLVAGRKPSRALKDWLKSYLLVTLYENPSNTQLDLLIAKARINVIPSMNATGVKLKLIHAVFTGGHCLTNAAGVAGSELESYCVIANSSGEFIAAIKRLYETPLTVEELAVRKEALKKIFDAAGNADRLSRLIW